MKKILMITTAVMMAVSLNSCGYKAQISAATSKSDSLQMVLDNRDALLNETFGDIKEIATSLAQISEREKIVVSASKGEVNQTDKQSIAENLTAISELLQKNRAAIARLSASTRQLKEANVKIASLDSLVASLGEQLKEKDVQLAQMSDDLSKLKIEITGLKELTENLTTQKASLETTVAEQTTDLNTVYWTLGSEKELQENGIVDKKGFIGRTLVLKDVANVDNFTKGDLRNIERIPIDKKGAKIVSSHPTESYELVMVDKNRAHELVIKDKAAFWKTSKVLVISYTKE